MLPLGEAIPFSTYQDISLPIILPTSVSFVDNVTCIPIEASNGVAIIKAGLALSMR